MAVKIQFRRGLASEWTSADPLLSEGEIGLELDTGKWKIGDGVTSWNSLGYASQNTIADVDGLQAALDEKAPLASPTLTGTPAAPTAPKATNTTQLATTAHVKSVVADYAPLASPALTGTPTAPTAPASTDSTQIATTAHVKDYLASIGHGDTLMNSPLLTATSTDWNDLPSEFGLSNRWKQVNGGTTVTNGPPILTASAYTHFYVTHLFYNANIVLQIALPIVGSGYDASIYIRSRASAEDWKPWYRQYSQYNILGTVSQSSGVPTGAVIERGSNSNGDYVKFADGTLIATFNASLSSGSYTWTYPVAFASAPQVSAIQVVGTATDLVSTTCSTPGTSSVTIYGNISTNSGTSWAASTSAIRLTAIGRWF